MNQVQEKSKTWCGIQFFQVQDDPRWRDLVNSGSLETILQRGQSLIEMGKRIEEKTGQRVLDTEIITGLLNDLRGAAESRASEDGISATDVLRQLETQLAMGKAVERLGRLEHIEGIKPGDDSGVFQVAMRSARKVVKDLVAGGDDSEESGDQFSLESLMRALDDPNSDPIYIEDEKPVYSDEELILRVRLLNRLSPAPAGFEKVSIDPSPALTTNKKKAADIRRSNPLIIPLKFPEDVVLGPQHEVTGKVQ